jgi:hypothetical protein
MRLAGLLLAGWLMAGVLALARAEGTEAPAFTVDHARTQLVDGVYHLNAGIRYELSPSLTDALHNGVALVFEVQVDVYRVRPWWVDAHVASLSQRYRLEYHALSRLYLVTHLNTGVQQSFFRFSSVLSLPRGSRGSAPPGCHPPGRGRRLRGPSQNSTAQWTPCHCPLRMQGLSCPLNGARRVTGTHGRCAETPVAWDCCPWR